MEFLAAAAHEAVTSQATPVSGSGLVDVEVAAAMLALSVSTVRRFARTGELPSVRMGRRLLFRREVLTHFAVDHEARTE